MNIRAAKLIPATFALALAVHTNVGAAGSTSANYALPSSTMNNGVGNMASATYKLSSSLGDGVSTARLTSVGFVLNSGFGTA